MKNSLFLICFGASIGIHISVITIISLPAERLNKPKPKKVIEVAYEQILAIKNAQIADQKDYSIEKPKQIKLPDLKMLSKNDKLLDNKHIVIRKEIFKDKMLMGEESAKKIVSMPNIPGEIFKSPEHKDYYYIIREKIRKYVYANFNKLEKGEVVITFSLARDGSLLELSVNDQKSSGSMYLRSIAIKSVKEAAPFPAFPKALRENTKLSFTVTFRFEYR